MHGIRSAIFTTLIGLTIICHTPILAGTSTDVQEKHIIGWIETALILPENLSFSAKIDTGADHSSLNVLNPRTFLKGEARWIRFSIPLKDGETLTLERPLVRMARIKRKGGVSQKRPVVFLDLCVGTIYKQAVPVNLANRAGFKYPMLIGRSFLKGMAIIDASLTFTQSPSCSVQ